MVGWSSGREMNKRICSPLRGSPNCERRRREQISLLSLCDLRVSARVIPKETKEILSISEDGSAKRTSIEEFGLTSRATKGKSIQQSDKLCDFLPLIDDKEVLVVSNVSQIRLKINEIPLLSRATMGVKVMKLKDKEKIQNLVGLNS